jgi:adenosylcobinamide-phosphate synthase
VAAGSLGVRLEKLGQYVLLAEGRAPTARDIGAARRLVGAAMVASGLIALAACVARRA